MKFIPLVVLVLIGLAASTTASAFPTDWKQQPYFDASTSELKLQTTAPVDGFEKCAWRVPPDGTTYTGPDTFRQPLDWTDFSCPAHVLWAKECKPGRQTVEFTKTIYLPGRPSNLYVSLVSFHDAPLSMSVEINDAPALSAVKSVHKRDLRGKGSLFKVGMNTITVEATKPRTGKPGTKCNIGTFDYGVLMQMRAVFENDFRAEAIPKAPGTFVFNLSVTNAGPSRASLASVGFSVTTTNLETNKIGDHLVAILISGDGIDRDECSYGPSSTSCPIFDGFDPGETKRYQIVYGYDAPPGDFLETWTASWGGSGDLVDPKPGNTYSRRTQGACRPKRPPLCI